MILANSAQRRRSFDEEQALFGLLGRQQDEHSIRTNGIEHHAFLFTAHVGLVHICFPAAFGRRVSVLIFESAHLSH